MASQLSNDGIVHIKGLVQATAAETARAAITAVSVAVRQLDMKGNQNEFARVHRQIGGEMQQAMLTSYDSIVGAHNRGRGGYRNDDAGRNRRYGGGLLREALASPSMVATNSSEIQFLNVRELNAKAPHWYRVAYGTNGRGTAPQARMYPMALPGGAGNLGVVGAPGAPSRSPHMMPRGRWSLPGTQGDGWVGASSSRIGQDEFWVNQSRTPDNNRPRRRRSSRRLSAGFEGRNYIDAAFETLARRIGPEYVGVVRRRVQQGLAGGGGQAARQALADVTHPSTPYNVTAYFS